MGYQHSPAHIYTALQDADAQRRLGLMRRARRAADAAARHAESVDREARFPQEALDAMKAEGLLGLMLPVEFGGDGASLAEAAAVCGALAQGCSSAAMIFALHQVNLATLVAHGMESPWHRSFMRQVAAEQLLVASAPTEAGVAGDLRNSGCAIRQDGGLFRLGKDAAAIAYGQQADALMVTARRNPDASSSDQALAVFVKGQYALRSADSWETLGMRGLCSGGWRFEGAAAVEQVLPRPFDDAAVQAMLVHSHLLWSSVWQGIAGAALSRAQAFVRAEARRRPDATPPGALLLADAAGKLQSVQGTLTAGLRRYEDARRDSEAFSSAAFAVAINAVKLIASRAAVEVCQAAMQIAGVEGYRNDGQFSVGRFLRDALSAPLTISNEQIAGSTAAMMLATRFDTELAG